jgi:hypothetical protein
LHESASYFIRIERSTQQSTGSGRWIRASSSVAVVSDTVRTANSLSKLTLEMNRGASYRIATLPLKSSPYPFSELCLLLSMFCIFSPDYKLLGEQCYWFVDVILQAVQKRSLAASVVREKKYHMAGKYRHMTVPRSSTARSKLVTTFEVLAAFSGLAEEKEEWWQNKGDAIDFLVLLLLAKPNESLPEADPVTAEVRRRATGALAMISKTSVLNQAILCEANAIPSVLRLLDHPSSEIQSYTAVILRSIASSSPTPSPLVDSAVHRLLHLLDSPDPSTCTAARCAVTVILSNSAHARHGALEDVPNILVFLASPSVSTRENGACILSIITGTPVCTTSQIEGEILLSVYNFLSSSSPQILREVIGTGDSLPHNRANGSKSSSSPEALAVFVSLLALSYERIFDKVLSVIGEIAMTSPSLISESLHDEGILPFLLIVGMSSSQLRRRVVATIDTVALRLPGRIRSVQDPKHFPLLVGLLSFGSTKVQKEAEYAIDFIGRQASVAKSIQSALGIEVQGLFGFLTQALEDRSTPQWLVESPEAITSAFESNATLKTVFERGSRLTPQAGPIIGGLEALRILTSASPESGNLVCATKPWVVLLSLQLARGDGIDSAIASLLGAVIGAHPQPSVLALSLIPCVAQPYALHDCHCASIVTEAVATIQKLFPDVNVSGFILSILGSLDLFIPSLPIIGEPILTVGNPITLMSDLIREYPDCISDGLIEKVLFYLVYHFTMHQSSKSVVVTFTTIIKSILESKEVSQDAVGIRSITVLLALFPSFPGALKVEILTVVQAAARSPLGAAYALVATNAIPILVWALSSHQPEVQSLVVETLGEISRSSPVNAHAIVVASAATPLTDMPFNRAATTTLNLMTRFLEERKRVVADAKEKFIYG